MFKKLVCFCSFLLLLGITSTSSADLVAFYSMDEGAGNLVADGSGNSFDGTPEVPALGFQWVEGKEGTALRFAGAGSPVYCGTFDPSAAKGQFTISCWVKSEGANGTYQGLLSKRDAYAAGQCRFNLETGNTAAGGNANLSFTLQAVGNPRIYSAYAPPIGTWDMVTITFDGTNARMYVNGVLNSGPTALTFAGGETVGVRIGTSNPGGGSPFNGAIDEVYMFDSALTIEEIASLMAGDMRPAGTPGLAKKPVPGNKSEKVSVDIGVISWAPGEFVEADGGTHDVFFGTDKDNVTNATTSDPLGTTLYQGLDVNSIEMARLEYSTTYYWRVDEVNVPSKPGTVTGNVWYFTTEPKGYALVPANIINVIGYTPVIVSDEQEPNMTCNKSGLDVNDMHSTEINTMWLGYSEDPEDPVWIQYEFDQIYKFYEMLVWNYNEVFPSQDYGARDVNVTYSIDGENWKALDDLVEFQKATGGNNYIANTSVDMNDAVAKYIKLTFLSSWTEDVYTGGLSEVRFMVIPTRASTPDPASAATNIALDRTLSWKAGRDVAEHYLYIGTDANAVEASEINAVKLQDATYSPTLELSRTYYWKVEEVNEAEEFITWDCPVWSFSTITNIVVENFETGYDASDANAVWVTWIDGFNDAANGAEIGKDLSAPGLSTINHNGGHSAPMSYDNTKASKSEITALTINLPIETSNWTTGSPTTLVIWIYGDLANDPAKDRLYAKIGTAKIYFTGDISKPRWMQFNVDLSTPGINKNNVSSITIGVEKIGTTGGTGIVLIDDLRLYRVAPALPLEEIWVEAESGTITPTYQKLSELTGASGGQYVGVPDGTGNSTAASPDPNATNTLSVTVSGGVYRIDMRFYVVGSEAGGDSCWVKIPTATAVKTAAGADVTFTPAGSGWVNSNNLVGGTSWLWDTVLSANNGNADVYWTLPAGTHTIKIANREDGLMLDAIVLVKVGE